MSSPSRPASHALMILSMSSRFSRVSINFSCFLDFASRGTSLKPSGGTIGRSAIFHFFHFSSYSSGSASWARSRPTEGFSAMTRVLGIQSTIAPLGMGAGPGYFGRVRPSPFYYLVAGLSWPVLRWLYRLRAEGEENLPDQGGYVLAANHISNLDPWPLGIPLWPKHFLRFMAKSELYWWPLNHVIKAGGGFPVRRGERDLEAIQTAVELAREGNVVAMF